MITLALRALLGFLAFIGAYMVGYVLVALVRDWRLERRSTRNLWVKPPAYFLQRPWGN